MIQDLSEELAKSFNFDSTNGVLIGDVMEDSPAAKAGLKSGDIVTKFNGQGVETANELRNAVAATAPDHEVSLEIFRDGERKTIKVNVGQLDEDKVAAAVSGRDSASDLGMTVETVTPQLASQLGLENGARGVAVTKVDQGSMAARVGIVRGDIVVTVGDEEIRDVKQFREAMRQQSLKDGIRLQVMRDGIKRFVFVRSE
jgi:serine protease Do